VVILSKFIKKGWLLFIYLFVNCIYLLKYGIRQDYLGVIPIIILYNIGVVTALWLVLKWTHRVNSWKKFNFSFLIVGVLIAVFFVMVNLTIDPETLNVLRYKGLNTTISHTLRGSYPYSIALDDGGDTTSNLPGLFYIGLPFYLMGDVGYLQVFVFICLFGLLYKGKLSQSKKVILLFLLLLSPAYWWEVVVKSDAVSILFLLGFFMIFWNHKYPKDYFRSPILLGVFMALFALTRLIVAIPLLVMFFVPFLKADLNKKLKFTVSFMVTLILVTFPIVVFAPSKEVLLEYNPLNNQTSESPWYLSVSFLLIALLSSKKSQQMSAIFKSSTLLVFGVVGIRCVLNGFEEGFYKNIYESLFDISYFGFVIPFIFFYLFSRKNIMHA
jgi:hypothetical protein